jgi:uncharacterized surface protein with fasciclin (FAS1) repeats
MNPKMMRTPGRWALMALSVLALAACGDGADKAAEAGTPEPSNRTLAQTIGDGDHAVLEGLVDSAGLEAVLAGKGPYTVFAPSETALTAAGTELTGEGMEAQSAALLRAHIVPGALTRTDILAAVDRAGAEGAKVRTMSDGLLTLSRDGDTIVVTAEDGATTRLIAQEALASNGVVQPVEGVLVRAE